MKLQLATRKQAKIKMALQGPSGSGKTMSSLMIAFGLCQDWGKIAVIDTENHSASLYTHLGQYSVVNISAPFSPEKYIEAIKLCEQSGIEVVIIDSISHEWDGMGGILDIHSNMVGNSFTNWSKLTPRHNAFIQTILQASLHVIATIRSKQEYVITEKNGKHSPEKVGLKGITREGIDYELTIAFELDMKHNANASKDRTGLFMDKPEFKITPAIGERILEWCMQGERIDFKERINKCKSLNELLKLYEQHPEQYEKHQEEFVTKKHTLQQMAITSAGSLTNKINYNGNGTSK